MDAHGYPDEDELERIRRWPADDFAGLMAFVENLWRYADWGFRRDGDRYTLSTGGWSGNEDIIGALADNRMFWLLCWQSSRRGGQYVFDLSDDRHPPAAHVGDETAA